MTILTGFFVLSVMAIFIVIAIYGLPESMRRLALWLVHWSYEIDRLRQFEDMFVERNLRKELEI